MTNQQIETVEMFDYWAFHADGSAQLFTIMDGEVIDYFEIDRPEDEPVFGQQWHNFGPHMPRIYANNPSTK